MTDPEESVICPERVAPTAWALAGCGAIVYRTRHSTANIWKNCAALPCVQVVIDPSLFRASRPGSDFDEKHPSSRERPPRRLAAVRWANLPKIPRIRNPRSIQCKTFLCLRAYP